MKLVFEPRSGKLVEEKIKEIKVGGTQTVTETVEVPGPGGDDTNVHTIFFEKAGPSSYATGGFTIDLSSTFSSLGSVKLMVKKGTRGNVPWGRLEYDLNAPSAGQVTVKVKKYEYERATSFGNVTDQPSGVTVQATANQNVSLESGHVHTFNHDHAAETSAAMTAAGGGVDTNALGRSISQHTHSVDLPQINMNTAAGSHLHQDNSLYIHRHDLTYTTTNVSEAELTNATNLSGTEFFGRATGQRA